MFSKILVPIDLEHENPGSRAIPVATELADKHGGRISMLHVIAPTPAVVSQFLPAGQEKANIADAKRELGELVKKYNMPADTEIIVVQGDVYPQIINVSSEKGIGLTVMSSQKPGLSTYFLGSNAARVVRHSECSVLVLR